LELGLRASYVAFAPERSEKWHIRASTVLPGVHLLGDDVGLFADAAGEELGVLEDGGANLAEAVAGEDLAGDRLDVIPECGFGGKKVAGAADGFQG
jgi:hypothetical protein